jgi:hypothetical protein
VLSYDTTSVGWRLPRHTPGRDEFSSFGSVQDRGASVSELR